ncbi:hypothetical protein K1719_041044 [Acacia pycnantha]|nr:hypothetical protein K1719_041044 [Acacia pycnantha]
METSRAEGKRSSRHEKEEEEEEDEEEADGDEEETESEVGSGEEHGRKRGFHELSEFDNSKRSCRRRLAGHNERRRKVSSDYQGEGYH